MGVSMVWERVGMDQDASSRRIWEGYDVNELHEESEALGSYGWLAGWLQSFATCDGVSRFATSWLLVARWVHARYLTRLETRDVPV